MKKINFYYFCLTLVFFCFFLLSPRLFSQDLLPRHQEWLSLVNPIITKTEKDVFLRLKTSEERDKFIQLFWTRRDPRPDTLENEFYQEYMKRVHYADLHFGHNTPKKGHETERGYFYLLLGPPLERQSYATQSNIWPLELWYYQGKPEYGLPSYFYLLFYQRYGMGEFKLYSPTVEGPEKLLVPTMSARVINRQTAYQVLKEISGELAAASISFIPGETTLGLTSLSSDTLISNLYALAEKQFSDAYARTFLAYKDYIETDYTHNYIESEATAKVFFHGGQPYLHWSLEPTRVNLFQSEEKSYASFQLILRLENSQGETILEKEEEIPFELPASSLARHRRQLLAFQDILPVIPGKFNFYLFLKNKTAKDFTSYQTSLFVPSCHDSPQFSDILLFLDKELLATGQQNKSKAFSFAGYQFIFNTQAKFLPEKPIGLFTQIINLATSRQKFLQVSVYSLDKGKTINQEVWPLEKIFNPNQSDIILPSISKNLLPPGYYQLQLSLVDQEQKVLATKSTSFVILSSSFPVVPWVFSKLRPRFPNPDDLYLLATEYFLNRQYSEAEQHLHVVLQSRDDNAPKLLLAKTYYGQKKYEGALSIAQPLYEQAGLREAGKILANIFAEQKKWDKALNYLEQLLSKAVEIPLLNLAAQGYAETGQPEKALNYLNRSLELNPNQPQLQKLKEKLNKLR